MTVMLAVYGAMVRQMSRPGLIAGLALTMLLAPFVLGYVDRYEAEHSLTFLNYFLFRHDGGTFTHSVGGGNDVAALGIGLEFYSPYKLLRLLFPMWLALLLEKAAVYGLAYGGAYLLLRRFVGVPAALAGPLGLLPLIDVVPFDTLFRYGYHVMPMVAYLCCLQWRDGRTRLLASLLILYAAGANPVHNLPNLGAAAIFGPLLAGRFSLARSLTMAGGIAVVSLMNWSQALYGWMQLSPFSNRLSDSGGDFSDKLIGIVSLLHSQPRLVICLAIALVLRGSGAWRAFWGLSAFLACYAAVMIFPWQGIGLGFVPLVASYASGFLVCASLIFTGLAARTVLERAKAAGGGALTLSLLLVPVVAIYALFGLARLDLGAARTLIHSWNQGYHSGIANLAHPDWRSAEPSRTVALNSTVPLINILAADYGLETFGGIINLKNARHELYWSQVDRTKTETAGNHGTWLAASFDQFSQDDLAFKFEETASLRLLAIANVRYVVCECALAGPNLRQISGPRDKPARSDFFADNIAEKLEHYQRRLKRFLRYGDVRVYEIPDPFPRAFAPVEVAAAPAGISGPDFIRLVERTATTGRVVARAEDLPEGSMSFDGSLKVTAYHEVKNGMDLTVSGGEGLVVVNVAFLPFWQAEADGQGLAIIPVNEIQMAVRVPAGAERVRFRYRRPGLEAPLDRLAEWLRFGGADR